MYGKLEESSAPYDLQSRQNNLLDVHVADEHVTGDLSYILEETEVECLILQPRDLQVTVDISTVGVPVSKIPIVMLFVGWNGEAAIGTDANCNQREEKHFRTEIHGEENQKIARSNNK